MGSTQEALGTPQDNPQWNEVFAREIEAKLDAINSEEGGDLDHDFDSLEVQEAVDDITRLVVPRVPIARAACSFERWWGLPNQAHHPAFHHELDHELAVAGAWSWFAMFAKKRPFLLGSWCARSCVEVAKHGYFTRRSTVQRKRRGY